MPPPSDPSPAPETPSAPSPVRRAARPGPSLGLAPGLVLLIAVVLAGCQAVLPVLGSPQPLPQGREPGFQQLPDGTFQFQPASAPVVVGIPYEFTVYTHCGLTPVSFDFDGAFWNVIGQPGDGQGNPPPGIENPEDSGVILLGLDGAATWTSNGGVVVQLERGEPGPRIGFPCD